MDIKIARNATARNPCIELQRPVFVFSSIGNINPPYQTKLFHTEK